MVIANMHKNTDSDGWKPLRPGIERRPLAKDGEKGIQADLIRIEPHFKDRPHTHDGFEWVYVLEGEFSDDRGTHQRGEFIINSTEGVHQPTTGDEGCLLLIFWTGSVTEVRQNQ
jgi:anti-sigma factor ChrR (cupin superfamily)